MTQNESSFQLICRRNYSHPARNVAVDADDPLWPVSGKRAKLFPEPRAFSPETHDQHHSRQFSI